MMPIECPCEKCGNASGPGREGLCEPCVEQGCKPFGEQEVPKPCSCCTKAQAFAMEVLDMAEDNWNLRAEARKFLEQPCQIKEKSQ
jgi:hypothetical protein